MRPRAENLKASEQKRIELLKLKRGLPHLYGLKFYPWMRKYFESTNKMNLLTAANQVGKSSVNIRKCIHWATDKSLWPSLWATDPDQFWYMYPTGKQINAEFETKWKHYLPREEYEKHPVYGWKVLKDGQNVLGIRFNSGVIVYFKSYSQDAEALQSSTCAALFPDEEMPVELYDEIMFRISATDGYFNMVFTATIGQELWRLAMEPEPDEEEKFPQAFKQTVSLYDCQFYEDGTPSHWTNDKIAMVKARCKNEKEILRRVFGRFIRPDSVKRVVPSFDMKTHMKPYHPVPPSWYVYSSIDSGSGGKAHKAAIIFLAVNPNFREGRVFLGWRGDTTETTSGDIYQRFVQMRGELKPVMQLYDYGDADMRIIASRFGDALIKAEKSIDAGEEIVDTLFQFGMLYVYDTPELNKLGVELSRLNRPANIRNHHLKNDMYDALRYACRVVPWDFTVMNEERFRKINDGLAMMEPKKVEETPQQRENRERREYFNGEKAKGNDLEDEINEWNEQYG